MSLVIDANENAYLGKQSNQNILTSVDYPDFNQILIKPSFGQITAIPSAVETVNGTPIHNISSVIYQDKWNESGSWLGNGNLAYWGLIANSESDTLRVATLGHLEGGETIGKQIIYAFNRVGRSGGAGGYIKFHAGLLHTDGTITYIGNQVQIYSSSFGQSNADIVSSGLQSRIRERFMQVENTAGVVAIAGDRVIVDLIFNVGGTTASTYGPIGFGSDGGGNATGKYNNGFAGYVVQGPCTPIQISIE